VQPHTGKLKHHGFGGPAGPEIQYNMVPKQRIQNMGPKQKIHAEAIAENTSMPLDVGRPSAAAHHMVVSASGGRHHSVIQHAARWYVQHCPCMYFVLLPHITFSDLPPYWFFCRVFEQLPCSMLQSKHLLYDSWPEMIEVVSYSL